METQQTPQVIQQPFAAQGDKNTIPNAATGTNKASLQEGFPPITGLPANKGGIPPERLDFNGAMNLNSQFYFAFQNGWWPTFSKQVSDAIGGYPKDAVLWLFDSTKSRARILQSLIPNNTYNFNTDASYIGKYWKELAQDGRGLFIGQVVLSQSNLATDNPGCLPLWTGEYYTNAVALYPDFYTWVKSHPELCKTKAEYDAAITTYGECPYYVADEVSGSLRLPKLANYIKMAGADGITQKGAGLPNITGSIDPFVDMNRNWSGALEVNNTAPFNPSGTNGNGNGSHVMFDASKSNAIYGASDTVQPAHTTLYPWVCAFNAAVPASTAQAAEFTAALAGKANATPAQSFINQSMAWGVPDYSAGVAVACPYTAPTAGLFVAFCTSGVDYIKIGGVDLGMRFSANNHAAVFVQAGDVISVAGTGPATCKFFPLKGALNA